MSRRERLEALQDRLTAAVEGAADAHLAQLVRELRAVLAEIEALPTTGRVTKGDELASARAARRKAAGVADRSPGSSKLRRGGDRPSG